MPGAFGNVAASFENVCSAVITVKLLRDKNVELSKMIESAKTYARKINKEMELPAELTEEKDLQNELKQELQNMLHYWSGVSVQYKRLCGEIKKFENFLTDKFTGNTSKTIPPEVIETFCRDLRKIINLAKEFYGLFERIVGYWSDSQLLAEKLKNKLKQRYEAASSAENRQGLLTAGTVGLTVLTGALGILGFFTGGATWPAAGAVGVAACGVGAGAVVHNSLVDVKALRQLANDIKGCSDKLGVIAKELENGVDTAIHLDEEMTAALQTLFSFAMNDQQKDDFIAQLEKGNAQLQSEKNERDLEIARLQRENNELKQKQGSQGNI